ncbi:unnamed protein product [Rotaria sp. Silwood1]|nr:unnamed protein product [Rotaria sp. Silwood1]CAF1459225.1 unnamed protein product [Rotaria sp. Silwood1]CAF3551668.1 unnamed protein product [Rotaria sp. Silwood1]CAF3687046.1 unnamed protein product [Rotaria sp. Silwood1]CAF4857818.1 unnamed protein product [Rotaria sp. Silwood1]
MAKIPTRQLGKTGPQVSAIGFGAMVSAKGYGTPETDEERFKVYDRAIELGSNFFDTADVYGDSEDLLGRYFKKYPHQREKVFLGTKFALVMSPEFKPFLVRGDAKYVHEACEKSLKRLGLDSIDLYYAHCIDKTVPIEETVGAMKELIDADKVKYLGLSNCSSDTLRRAHAVHPIACVQIEYSPFGLDIEREEISLLKTCRELGVAIVCYSPLGRGMLTGQLKSLDDLEENDFRRRLPRFFKENFSKNLQLVDTLTALSKKKGCTPGQLTLAWILAQGDDFIPIPSTTKIKHLEENLAAVQIKFNEEEVHEIRQACEKADIAGGCCPENMSTILFADSAPKKN